MLKTRKKWISILLTLAMLVGLMVPFAGTAGAVGTVYTSLEVPPVEDDTDNASLGSFQIEIDPLYIEGTTHEAWVELPSDFEINQLSVAGVTYSVYSGAPAKTVAVSLPNGAGNVNVTLSDFNERGFKITLSDAGVTNDGQKFRVKIGFPDVNIPAGVEGDIKATITNIKGQLVSGSVVVATTSGGALKVAVLDSNTFSDAGDTEGVKIRVEETVAGKLKANDKLKLELPDGFEWGTPGSPTVVWGDIGSLHGSVNANGDGSKISITRSSDKDTLEISIVNDVYKSDARSAFEFRAPIVVADTDDAKYGDVIAKVKGDYDVSPSELVVGTYGDFQVQVEAEDPDIVAYAGQNDQDVSNIVIKESLKESLLAGRTITITLPENARWWKIDDQEVKPGDTLTDVADDNSVYLDFAGLQGTDDRTAKFTIRGKSTDAAELKIENISVALKAGVTGDLVAKVAGSQGVSGEITLAKVVNPVEVTAEKTNVQLGKFEQAAGKITITEAAAGAIDTDNGNNALEIRLPDGIKFSSKPDVEVTKGDLEVESVSLAQDDTVLKIKFKDDSNEASTIEISNISYDVDRTFGEGDIKVEVGGPALVQTDGIDYSNNTWSESYDGFFEDNDYVAKVVNATCVTPAPVGAKYSASFVIGSTTYTVNGVQNTMDVAAYTKDGRTYLPVRYVAYALGITPENILWDGKTATFIGEGRVVQVTPGSAVLTINGAPVTMDVTTDLVNGRVMVPFRWVAQAFGAQVNYDEATQTVSIN
ncbi:copper amine oxidase N-terminal domain-containing protein [Moorella sp. ACPs]|uniref:copper amine oxidase N-terminal domain-containing protein n=1 Tax=Neomoorella carbonis TaxID=3062783 RepID=UPI00324ADD3F